MKSNSIEIYHVNGANQGTSNGTLTRTCHAPVPFLYLIQFLQNLNTIVELCSRNGAILGTRVWALVLSMEHVRLYQTRLGNTYLTVDLGLAALPQIRFSEYTQTFLKDVRRGVKPNIVMKSTEVHAHILSGVIWLRTV
jgi:hypothetical protein